MSRLLFPWCVLTSLVLADQVNPALTFAMFATRKLSGLKALVYIVAQCLGAFLGAGAVYLALPSKDHIKTFVNKVSSSEISPSTLNDFEMFCYHVTIYILWSPLPPAQVPTELNAGQALGIEVLCTFQMVFTVFAVCDQKRRDCIEPGNLAIGFAHSTGALLGVRKPCCFLDKLLCINVMIESAGYMYNGLINRFRWKILCKKKRHFLIDYIQD